jgi:hypothetical protein
MVKRLPQRLTKLLHFLLQLVDGLLDVGGIRGRRVGIQLLLQDVDHALKEVEEGQAHAFGDPRGAVLTVIPALDA